MSLRFDLVQWRKEQTGQSYEAIAEASGLSLNAVWKFINEKCDPSTSTVEKLFIGMGLNPVYALDRKLKRSQFWRAVDRAAR